MGKTNQAGWILPKGKIWYGYFRQYTFDPISQVNHAKVVCIRLGPQALLPKAAARETLRMEIIKQTGHSCKNEQYSMRNATTFEWFVRNRYFPLRQGDWRPETAKSKMNQIQIDLIEKFGRFPLTSIDRFMLQIHINELANTYCKDRVKQTYFYLRSIFDEAVEQEFLLKDPARKLKIPKNLRPKDKQVLTWQQLRLLLAHASRRDQLLITLDIIGALRPSELFALRWHAFDDQNALSITETIYRRVIRPFGKTTRSLGKIYLPDGLSRELILWKKESPNSAPSAFIFPNADGGFMDANNYRNRVLIPLAKKLDIPKLNFQILRRTFATQVQNMGSIKDMQAHLRHARADTTANEYMQELPESVHRMVKSAYLVLAPVVESTNSCNLPSH